MKKIIVSCFIFCLPFLNYAQTAASEEPSQKDKEFVARTSDYVLMEVRISEFAQVHAETQDVKTSAELTANIQRLYIHDLADFAVRKNILMPEALSNKKQKKLDALTELDGKTFDKRYTKCMIKNFEKDLTEFKKEIEQGKDAEIKAWASSKLPVLQQQLEMWKETAKSIETKTAAKIVNR